MYVSYTKYADSEPDLIYFVHILYIVLTDNETFTICFAHFLYNCYNAQDDVNESRSMRELRQGCYLIYLGATPVTKHQCRLVLL